MAADIWATFCGVLKTHLRLGSRGLTLRAPAAGRWRGAVVSQPGTNAQPLTVEARVVAPAWQRRGIGSALMIGLMRAHPQARLQVSTARANAPALALYQRLGFQTGSQWALSQGLVLLDLTRPAFAEQPC